MNEDGRFPPWAYIGCGCLAAIASLVVVAVGVGIWGLDKARRFGEEMSDPAQREEIALEVLGAERLPEGYHAVVALSVPFLFELAILSDESPDEEGAPPRIDDRGFVYMRTLGFGDRERSRQLVDFFEGRTKSAEALDESGVDVRVEERVARGELERGDVELLWVTHRGRVDPDELAGSGRGLVTLVLANCDSSTGRRLGIWFGPDPDPGAPPGELDLAGTVGDASELERFFEPIRPCPGPDEEAR